MMSLLTETQQKVLFFLFLPTQISSHKIKIMCVMKFYFYFYFDRPIHFFKNQNVNHVIKNNWPDYVFIPMDLQEDYNYAVA